MNIRLEKKNRVTTDFIQIEVDGHTLRKKEGKIRKGGGANSSKHCGTNKKAKEEAQRLKQEYQDKKYIEVPVLERPSDFNGVFDKAKWHFSREFPEELDIFQGYVHTGFYLAWLIEKGLFETNGDELLNSEIEKVRKREITGAKFFERNLDGVFMDDDLTEIGNEFSYEYYDKEIYLEDYSKTLGTNLSTLYHIQDNWTNYEKLKPILEKRFNRWTKSKKSKWWKFD